MNAQAQAYGEESVRYWVKELAEAGDLSCLWDRIKRWTDVAALVALGVDPERPIITADLLVTVRPIAIAHHELAWSILEGLGRPHAVH